MSIRLCKQKFPSKYLSCLLSLALSGLSSPIAASEQYQEKIGLFTSYETLSNGQSPWKLVSLQWQQEEKNSRVIGLELNEYHRFDKTDISFSGQYIKFLKPDWYIDTTLVLAPNPAFFKKQLLQIWSRHSYEQGLGLSIGLNGSVYPTSTVDIRSYALMAEVEKYIGNYRYAYKLSLTDVILPLSGSQILFSHAFTESYYYGDRSNVTFTLATGVEVENDGSSTPPLSRVNAISIKQTHYYKNHLNSVFGLNWHQQGNYYIRSGISLGISYEY